jgi:atypical dual specificity phosphatase
MDLSKVLDYLPKLNIREYLPETLNENIMYCVGDIRYRLQPYLSKEFTASQITNRIFISDIASIMNKEELKKNGITHIVSVFNGAKETYPKDFTYKLIHINDDHWVPIKNFFDETTQFIHESLENNEDTKVLVHCQRGVSRSVSVVLAYLLFEQNNRSQIEEKIIDKRILETLKFVQSKREIAEPNKGFLKNIKEYVMKLNDYTDKEVEKEEKDEE